MLLRGSKGDNGAGLLRAVTISCAAVVEDFSVEAWVMRMWDKNQEILSEYC